MDLFSSLMQFFKSDEPLVTSEPRELSVGERELLERWYAEKLWKNDGYRARATKLFSGFGGSLQRYLRRHTPTDAAGQNAISFSDMLHFLTGKGHAIEMKEGRIHVVGVEAVIFGRAYPIDYYEGVGT